MKALRALSALILLAPAFFVGRAAILQFEKYQESYRQYLTPFHGFNIIVLTLVAVAFLAAAITVFIDVLEDGEMPIGISNYLRAVFFGTAGTVAFGIGLFEENVRSGSIPSRHFNVYHGGDAAIVILTGIVLVMFGFYYLLVHKYAENATLKQRLNAFFNGRSREEPETEEIDEEKADSGDGEFDPGIEILIIDRTVHHKYDSRIEIETEGIDSLQNGDKRHYAISVSGDDISEMTSAVDQLLKTTLTE